MGGDREAWFELLGSLYEQTGHPQGELKICTDCVDVPCEVGPEQVTLLPHEAEFIQARLRAEEREEEIATIEGIAGCALCPFFQHQRCSIHPHRPIDCRTYPLVPTVKSGAVRFQVSGVCPRWDYSNAPFVDLMAKVWRQLIPHLSADWWRGYAARQPRKYLQPLTQIR